jgi:hypothetical protein
MTEAIAFDGVQLVDFDELDDLVTRADRLELSVAMLSWIASEAQRELDARALPTTVRIVLSCYAGSAYPTLGVHYRAACPDVAPMLRQVVQNLLRDGPVEKFLKFVATSPVDFAEELRGLQREAGIGDQGIG